jgi:hypothetical protein
MIKSQELMTMKHMHTQYLSLPCLIEKRNGEIHARWPTRNLPVVPVDERAAEVRAIKMK